ncbi:hypothetical protein GCM10011382_01160 [Vreelandella lutescens]|uniref:Uncharacterized protein n=1 Tax=Vreelandella lutescens TaxID=1602943 RepID=A0ABQ1NFG0_9GAMM|nr:hypothetical protein GCM10011382_01160 [Halomonas lutescens]
MLLFAGGQLGIGMQEKQRRGVGVLRAKVHLLRSSGGAIQHCIGQWGCEIYAGIGAAAIHDEELNA